MKEPYILVGAAALAVTCGLVLTLFSGSRFKAPRIPRRELQRLDGFQLSAGPYTLNPSDVSAAWRDVE